MRTAPLLLAMAAIAVAAALLASLILRPAAAPADDGQAAALAQIQRSLEELQRENLSLQKEIAELRSAPAAAGAGLSREPVLDEMVARAVERWMRENAEAAAAAQAGAEETAVAAEFSLEGALGQLMNPHLTGEEREALWQQALDSGKMLELIGALEVRAAADPRNTSLQFELGYAYLQPIISGQATGGQAGEWSMKADAAFDRTLALDATH